MDSVKFILLGNGTVGKTCMMLSFTGKPIRATHIKTIGIDMDKRKFYFQDREVEVKVWDTAGQEMYRNSLPKDLFNRLNGILLVYDVCNRASFESVGAWMKLIGERAPENTAVVLVGNKIDKENHQVKEKEGQDLADQFMIPFITTSAKQGQNVESAFTILLQEAVSKNPLLLSKKPDSFITVTQSERKKFLCC
jgi:small GTP-binding protein